MTAGFTSHKANGPNYNLQGNAEHCLLNTPCETQLLFQQTDTGTTSSAPGTLVQGNQIAAKFSFSCLLKKLAK